MRETELKAQFEKEKEALKTKLTVSFAKQKVGFQSEIQRAKLEAKKNLSLETSEEFEGQVTLHNYMTTTDKSGNFF